MREETLAAAEQTLDIVRRRYRAGEDDLTAFLQAQRSWRAAERSSVQAHAAELQQLTALYKAFGGGWQAIALPGPVLAGC